MKILIAEDSPICREILNKSVKAIFPQAEIDSFEDGTFAWEAAQKTHYDILITDYYMLKMNGPELALKIHEKDPDTQILFQTSVSAMELMQSGLPLERCINKPVTPDVLKEKLDELETLPPFRIKPMRYEAVKQRMQGTTQFTDEQSRMNGLCDDLEHPYIVNLFSGNSKRNLLEEVRMRVRVPEISDIPVRFTDSEILDIFEQIPYRDSFSREEWNKALDYCLKIDDKKTVKNQFAAILCNKGLSGGELTVESEVTVYRTGKASERMENKRIEIREKNIARINKGWHLCLPAVSFEMKSGEQYKFVVFSRTRFINLIRHNLIRR